MGKTIAVETGRALRRARTARGLTLRDVGERSGGDFTPTAVAGYERGERNISLERFCGLAEVYGIRPERLLAEIVRERDGRPPIVIDLTRIDALEEPPRALIEEFVDNVRRLRNEQPGETISLRVGDVEVLATSAGLLLPEFLELVQTALRTS